MTSHPAQPAAARPAGDARAGVPSGLAGGESSRNPLLGLWLAHGFTAAIAMWAVWFLTHLPAVRVPPTVAGPLILLVMGAVLVWSCARLGGGVIGWLAGLGGGVVAGVVNLLILGSKLVEQPADLSQADAIGTLRPGAGLIAAGFLVLSGAIGAAAGAIGSRWARAQNEPVLARDAWLARLGMISAVAVAPLLLIGGLVTSTDSGMAVPDWPGTYGANMFLYPVALMADERIFLEHTHRLFGSLVGLTVLTLFIATLIVRPKARARALVGVIALVTLGIGALVAHLGGSLGSGALFPILAGLGLIASAWLVRSFLRENAGEAAGALGVLVALQGIAGGVRVTENALGYALLHGVGGQVVFALAVCVGAMLSLGYQSSNEIAPEQGAVARRARTLAIAALACLFVQLVFGAMYRHLGSAHALWSHVLFAFVVVIVAGIAGATATNKPEAEKSDASPVAPTPPVRWLRRFGMAAMVIVGVQFVLGWATLAAVTLREDRGAIPTADQLADAPPIPVLEALITTSHQATGALLLAGITLTAVWAHRTARAQAPRVA